MKKTSLMVIGILIVSGFGINAVSKNDGNEIIQSDFISFSEPLLQDHNQYITVNIDETSSYAREPGNPLLPTFTKLYTFPIGTVIKEVSCISSSIQKIPLSKEILPASYPSPVSFIDSYELKNHQVKNNVIYQRAKFYPDKRFSYRVGRGLDGDNQVLLVAIQYFPLMYSPSNNVLLFSSDATINIIYENPIDINENPDDYDLVIIAPSEFTASLQPLIDHKNQFGIVTTLKTTEDIYSEYQGRDEEEKIKYFIKDSLEVLGVDYVIVMGSIYKVPMRYSMVSLWHFEEDTLTDLYYSDIYDQYGDFSSWDTNNNDKFGENDDDVDLYPDVHIGRLACDSVEEVDIVVDKIIHYETETYESEWFYDMIFIGGNTFRWNPGYEGEENNQIIMDIMSDFDPTLIWTSLRNFNRRTINNAINQGAGFLDYSGHGFEHGMGTYPPLMNRLKFYFSPYINDLVNGYQLPIMFFDACLTAKLDFILQDILDYKEYFLFNILAKIIGIDTSISLPVFAWYFVKHEGGGAIATIGATRTAYGGVDDGAGKMSIEFFSAYESSDTLGQMMTQAQNEYITDVPNDEFTVEEFTLLGDPTLKLGGYP
jgi:hypothetical protein